MDIFKFGWKYWKKYVVKASICQLMGFVVLTIGLLLPQLNQLIIDYVINYNPESTIPTNNIFAFLLSGKYGVMGEYSLFWSIAIMFVGLLLIRDGLLYARNNLFIVNGLNMEKKLRMETYKKLMSQNSAVLSRYNTGDLLNILNNDIINFKELYCFVILVLVDAVFTLTVAIILLARVNIYFIFIPIAICPLLVLALRKFMSEARKISTEIRDRSADMNMVVQENIHAVRLVRSFANEQVEMEKFQKRNQAIRKTYFKHADIISKYGVIFNTIRQLAYIASLAIGTVLIFNNKISVGALVAFTGYIMVIMDCVTNLNNFMFTAQQYIVSGGRVMVFLQTGNIIDNPFNPLPITREPNIHVENMSIIMDEHQVLKDITLDIPYGKSVGIMGGTGSGKTVLLKTLARLHDPTSGMVAINGMNLREYDLEEVRRQFSFVFQDVFLFSNTIDANIAYYDTNAPRDKVEKVAAEAQAADFIPHMPDGYDTIIGEKGLGLSGGQKQRLSIARALLKNSPILVLDDATSALDMHTERELLECIEREYSTHTLLISAHRASSVSGCDEIIYLQDGEIVERGTFQELMALNGRYAHIYRKQSALSEANETNINRSNHTQNDTSDPSISTENPINLDKPAQDAPKEVK